MPPRRSLKPLQTHWIILLSGVSLLGLALLAAAFFAEGRRSQGADAWFYADAFVNLAGILGAFALRQKYLARLRQSRNEREAFRFVQIFYLVPFIVLYAAAFFAGLAAYASGELFNLLFTLPFFAYGVRYFPSRKRVEHLLQRALPGTPSAALPPSEKGDAL